MKNNKMGDHKFDLNFVQSDIDLKNVEPNSKKQLSKIINEYLLRMCDILNGFMTKMESRVISLDNRLNFVETKIILLEKKLENVNINAAEITSLETTPSSATVPANIEAITFSESVEKENPTSSKSNEDIVTVENRLKIEKDKEEEGSELIAMQDHPRYVKYFKMLRIGISEAAVQQKMVMDGEDPAILRSPHTKMANVQNETSEEDYSNENSSNDGFSSS